MEEFFLRWMSILTIQLAPRTFKRLPLCPVTTAQQQYPSISLLSNARNASMSPGKRTNSSMPQFPHPSLLTLIYGSKHIKLKHERPYGCAHYGCERTFGLRTHLERHQTTHTEKKEFECPNAFCKTQFTREDSLKRHIKGCIAST